MQIGGGQALVAAMKAKRIDAFMLSAPAPYLLERDKVGTVILRTRPARGRRSSATSRSSASPSLKSWAEKNPKLVEAYIRSLNQAYDWMLANRPAALAHLKKYFAETDEATLKISFDALIPSHPEGRRG